MFLWRRPKVNGAVAWVDNDVGVSFPRIVRARARVPRRERERENSKNNDFANVMTTP